MVASQKATERFSLRSNVQYTFLSVAIETIKSGADYYCLKDWDDQSQNLFNNNNRRHKIELTVMQSQ